MSPTHSNNPSQVHLVFQASNDRGVLQQAVPVQQSHMSPIPVELERRMLQQPMHAQRSPFPPMPMPIYSYNSPVFHMPTISQQPMPMHPWPMSPMPAQQAPTENAYLENAKKKMSDAPSSEQIQTFRQRAWSSEKFQIGLHEWVGERKKERWINEKQEEALCHRIHRRDHGCIKKIIDICDYDYDEETSTHEVSKKMAKDYVESKKRAMVMEMLEGIKECPKDAARTFLVQLPANACKGQVLTLKAPDGLPCAGQETTFTLPEGVKGGQIISLPCPCEADVKPFLSSRLRFKRTARKKSAHILQVPCKMEEDIFNVQLVRYFVEHVWKLERPDVIISVTGGAAEYNLPPEHNAMLMRGMMEGTRKLKPWSVSIYGCISFVVRLW